MTTETRSIFHHAGRLAGDLGSDPTAFDPAFVEQQLGWVGRLFGPGRYFDVHVQGWERLPEGPVLLVSNHSGGTTVLDCWGMMWAWYNHHGVERPLYGLAHDAVFATRPTGRYFSRCGVLRAGPDVATRVLRDLGRSLMVMPGGDQDVWRPASERFQVRFAGRKGYARTALSLGVPIVPVAHVGAHHTLHVLTDGRQLARRLGLHRIARAEVFPVHLSLPWGVGIGPWPHLPPPTRLDYRLGPAIFPTTAAEVPTQAEIDALDEQVRSSIQGMLDDMKHDRPSLSTRAGRALQRGVGALLQRVAAQA